MIGAWDGWRGNFYRLAVGPSTAAAASRAGSSRPPRSACCAKGAPRVTALVAFDDDVAGGFWEAAGYTRVSPVWAGWCGRSSRTAARLTR